MPSTPTEGIENRAFNRNTESLFEELSSAGSGLIGDVDEGADLLGTAALLERAHAAGKQVSWMFCLEMPSQVLLLSGTGFVLFQDIL